MSFDSNPTLIVCLEQKEEKGWAVGWIPTPEMCLEVRKGEQPLRLPPQYIIGQPHKRLSRHGELAAFSARILPNHPASPLHKWQYWD